MAQEEVGELLSCKPTIQELSPNKIQRIAFGSCMHQNQDLALLSQVIEQNPDLFIFLGDNIYGDTKDMKLLAAKYSKLCARPEFDALVQHCPIIATWDDHDYGENDAGKEYPLKAASRKLFLDFWNEPQDSERRKHEGIYHSYYHRHQGKTLQIILLDTRSFRSKLLKTKDQKKHRNDYRPNFSKEATMLGSKQWAWLQKELSKKADLRLICSSTQFAVNYNGYEAWANFPEEQKKMLELIKTKEAENLVFISGDVHYGELSKINSDGLYPIYDCTSSGINREWPHVEANSNRIGKACSWFNFGLLEIDWDSNNITFSIINNRKQVHLQHQIALDSLKFPNQ